MNREQTRRDDAMPSAPSGPAAEAFGRAGAAFRAGRMDEAEALLREAVRLDPGYAEAYNRLGFLAAQRGDGNGALENLRKAAALKPGSAEFASNLGSAELKFGDTESAVNALESAVAINPALAQTQFNLGLALQKQGDHQRAVSAFQQALALRPNLAEALFAMGESLRQSARYEEAVAAFERLAALAPKAVRAHLHLAHALEAAGRFEEAATAVRGALALEPNNATALNLYASCLITVQRDEEAISSAREALRVNPNDAVAHNLIASCLWQLKRKNEAGDAAREALRIDPDNVYAQYILASHHLAGGRVAEAEEAAQRVIALDPDFADGHIVLGRAFATTGRTAEAAACFEKALSIDPDSPEAIYELVQASKKHATAEFAAHIDRLLTDQPRADRKALLHFSLGRICDRLGEYPRAFKSFAAAKKFAGRRSSFDAERWSDDIDRMIETFTLDFFAARRGFGSESERPIFIVGMPRSGTTLTEQILASHPDVAGGGELAAIPALAKSLPQLLGSSARYPECLTGITQGQAADAAAGYLATLNGVSAAALRVTDKMPFNFLHLGFLSLLFPRGNFIHCRRDPMDTCLSCFFTAFEHDVAFTFRLEDLGTYYRGYLRLMDHWRKVLPIRVMDVEYETVIENQEEMSRHIVAHCGLEWDERCLDFHKTERPVQTASIWQVRQPIYTSAVKRWRRYESFLAPLRAALEGRNPA